MRHRHKLKIAVRYVAIYVSLVVLYFPILWMFVCSIKPSETLFSVPPRLIPKVATLRHYVDVLNDTQFVIWVFNTLVLSIGSSVLSVVLSIPGAYGLSRFRYGKRSRVQIGVLMVYMIPPILLCIPFFILFSRLRLIDTRIGLILAYTVFSIPFCLWFLKSYLDTVPEDLDEQATIDGCSRFRALWEVILPLAVPGIFAAAVYGFVRGWAEYLYALIFINSESKRTLSLGLADMIARSDIPWGQLLASSMMSMIPTIVFFIFIEKHFVAGLAAGALKD